MHSTGSSGSKKDADKDDTEKEKDSSKEGSPAMVSYGPTEFPRVGETQSVLYTNLAALHIQDGNLKEAERCCERALQVQPRALAPLRSLVYILLSKGQHAAALQRLR